MNNLNTLLLHSGGLDSSILGCEFAKQGINFSPVFIDFSRSGKNSKLKTTKSASSILGAPLDVIEVPILHSPFVSSSASTLRVTIRDEAYLNWAVYYCMELLLHEPIPLI
jgi:7-cyano-7-deazaguanine synthase in queuosine biosynthesis